MRRARGLVVGALLLHAAGLWPAAAAEGGVVLPEQERRMVELVNRARAELGLPPLAPSERLLQGARRHSLEMLGTGVHHASRAALRAAAFELSPLWRYVGENVGAAVIDGSRDQIVALLHDAFLRSPSHRANLLADYTVVAVGIVEAPDGTLYVTERFVALPGPAGSAPPPGEAYAVARTAPALAAPPPSTPGPPPPRSSPPPSAAVATPAPEPPSAPALGGLGAEGAPPPPRAVRAPPRPRRPPRTVPGPVLVATALGLVLASRVYAGRRIEEVA